MRNELLELIEKETEGLVRIDFFPSYEDLVGKLGFKHDKTHSLKNIAGNDSDVLIYMKDNFKAVRVMVEVETESEGILSYQTYYASPAAVELFTISRNF